ncbi:uncharacterized protein LOC114721106 [Neltuma alba]|uniref:uncharacterized protein LOC114721106 n=1 Tax=Neltuma alba TaxID=207710 RepID=UPI0010A40F0C|nr:uncharacterized protein LOC114721106 [Prosopis alba]
MIYQILHILSLSSLKTYRNQKIMCVGNKVINSIGLLHSSARKRRSKRPKVQVYKFARRSERMAGEEMMLKNLKLYLENQIISEENKKLKNKVVHLQQEKLVLMSGLEKKFHRLNLFSVTL